MGHGVIDGDRWIRQRLAFLNDALRTDLTEEQREAVQDEIRRLSGERGIRSGGRRRLLAPSRWIGRWARRGPSYGGAGPADQSGATAPPASRAISPSPTPRVERPISQNDGPPRG